MYYIYYIYYNIFYIAIYNIYTTNYNICITFICIEFNIYMTFVDRLELVLNIFKLFKCFKR